MRYLILSDIHGNKNALDSVLEDSEGQYDAIVNCGDLVGYGPDPNQIVDWCRATGQHTVRGNHDKACVGLADLDWFNPDARASAIWTGGQLTADNREFLLQLAKGPIAVDSFEIFHGAVHDEDEYLLDFDTVELMRSHLAYGLAFFGHTHLQGGFILERRGVRRIEQQIVELQETAAYLINPGSVGQPRDYDPRAAYAIYDDVQRLVWFERVGYDVSATDRKIAAAGLPEFHGRRLHLGL